MYRYIDIDTHTCTCTYTNVYLCNTTYTNVHLCTYTMYTSVHIHKCTHLYIYKCIPLQYCIHKCIPIQMYTSAILHIQMYTSVQIPTYISAILHIQMYTYTNVYLCNCIPIQIVGEEEVLQRKWAEEVLLQEIRRRFEFVPGLFGTVLQGGYLYGAWPRTALILFEFKLSYQNCDTLSCSVPVGFPRKDSNLLKNFPYG